MNKTTRHIALLSMALLLAVTAIAKNGGNVNEQDKRKAQYVLLEAENQKQQGNTTAFFDLLQHAHSIDSTNTTVAYYLGYCLLSLHDVEQSEFEKGIKLMRAHIDAHPGDYYEAMLYSDACMAVGQVQEALRVTQKIARQNPHKVEVQMRLAAAHSRTGQYRKAIEVYDSIESMEGKSIYLTANKVRAFQLLNDTTGALSQMRQLLQSAPRSADYNIAMASMFSQFDMADSALVYLNKAQLYEPDNGSTYLAKAQYYYAKGDSVGYDRETYQALTSQDLELDSKLQVLADYARQLLISNDSSQRARQLFDVLLQQHPHATPIRDLYSEYLVAKKDYKGAAEQLGYALDIDPTNAHSWHRLMLVNMMDDNYAAAIKAAKQALAINPDSIELYGYIAPAYYEMKQYDKAIETYNQALAKVDTTNLSMRSDLIGGKADVYSAMGDTLQAMATYEEALKVYSKNVSVMNNYAYALATAGQELDKAESLSGKAVNIMPQNATFLDTYAWVFFKKKDYKMALFYIKSAIDNGGRSSADVVEHYGDILYHNGQIDEAIEQWKQALEVAEKDDDTTLLKRKINDKKYYEK